mgnify:CR=1 FL=1
MKWRVVRIFSDGSFHDVATTAGPEEPSHQSLEADLAAGWLEVALPVAKIL